MKELLEAGVHFGHQTKRWNPKMKDYIFGQRNGIYIIDLQKTIRVFKDALLFIKSVAESGKEVLMVGTKKQAQDIIRDLSLKCESSYVNQRWLGGLLTNFSVIRGSVEKLIELDEMKEDGRWGLFSKKEQSKLEKVYRKLSKNLGGIKNMLELPGALFVIDSTKEEIAIYEARKLNIPIVAVVDTNGDPEDIDHPIPGNDDAVRAIELFTSKVSEAIIEGKKDRMDRELLEAKKEEEVSPEEEVTTPEEEGAAQEEEVAPPAEEEVPLEEKVVPPEEGESQATSSEEKAPSPSKPSDKEKEEGGHTEPEKSA
jgi:small subunit ribosomal protein S2